MKRFTRNTPAILLVFSVLLAGCGSEEPGTIQDDSALFESELQHMAQDTVRKMLELAEAGQWQTLIEQHYGEIDKMTDPSQLTELAEKFDQKYGPMLLPVLKQAAELTPTIEDKKAIFQVDGETIYELHLGDDGQYGFHL